MSLKSKPPALPSADKRWRIVEATLRRHGYARHCLIEGMHTVQESFGYLDEVSLRYLSEALRLPLSRVFGVATFYHYFMLKPQGEHSCVVCMGTACYIKGAPDLLKELEERYSVKPGETTEDGQLSVLAARCVGSCGLAPAAVLDGEVVGRLDRSQIVDRIRQMALKSARTIESPAGGHGQE